MSELIYSRLVNADPDSLDEYSQRLQREVKKAIVIKIDNVARYLFEDSPQENWDITNDFPNIAPPFERFWMEYSGPQFINSNGEVRKQSYEIRTAQVGSLFGAVEIPESDDNKYLTNAKWVYTIVTFMYSPVSLSGQVVISPFYDMIGVTQDGNVATIDGKLFYQTGFDRNRVSEFEKLGITPDHAKRGNKSSLFPMFLALSFLHCKNVELTTKGGVKAPRNKVDKPAKTKVYTLEISPMRRILESHGSKETGIKHALHICRGHFKDFSKGSGLFGKYKGMYWWDSQIRGKNKHGRIDKDYNVSPWGE